MINRLLKISLAVVLLGLSFIIGYDIGELQVKYVEVEIEKPVIQYEIVTVEKVIEVEVEVEKFVELRDFTSLAELKDWLDTDGTEGRHLVFGEDGIYPNPDYEDCDDYAAMLQQNAEEDGYRISIQIDTRKRHALNSVFIGNEVYFIEAQTDELWLECYRDK